MFCGTLLMARLRGSRFSPQSDLVFGQPLHALVGRDGEPGFRARFKAQQTYAASSGPRPRRQPHYLGHKNIQHTVRYTELAPARFNGFWDDERADVEASASNSDPTFVRDFLFVYSSAIVISATTATPKAD